VAEDSAEVRLFAVYEQALSASTQEAGEMELDAETVEHLKALGYVQ
jgi:hypothetical protein